MSAIREITQVFDRKLREIGPLEGAGGRRGIPSMLSCLHGTTTMDGYKVATDSDTYFVLIENGQSCCESWGYLTSEDDLGYFIGAELKNVVLTDTALNQERVEKSDYYDDDGGIQFVDFVTDRGTFQLAVYNAHNGYYGHSILVLKNDTILLEDVL